MPSNKVQARILRNVAKERSRQDIIHGERQDFAPERWLVILVEEVGEVSKAITERNTDEYYMELVHVAAVAVAALECFERKGEEMGQVELTPIQERDHNDWAYGPRFDKDKWE